MKPLTLPNPAHRLDDEQYMAFCAANAGVSFERTVQGEIQIVPPAGGESAYRCLKVATRLDSWAERDGRGVAFDSSVEYLLPNGAALSPDASWVSRAKLSTLTKQQRRQFLRLAPEFVVEVLSPSDRLATAQAKMRDWIDAGVELGWLIDADERTIHVHNSTGSQSWTDLASIDGEGPLAGFRLTLADIWAGL